MEWVVEMLLGVGAWVLKWVVEMLLGVGAWGRSKVLLVP